MGATVFIADDHSILREGLRSLLEKQRFSVVGEAANGVTTAQMVLKLKPDIVIMDISMPDMNGVEATRRITSRYPSIKVVALSMHRDKRFVTEMLDAGASGYLLKDCVLDEVLNALKVVLSGKTYISPGISGVVIEDYLRYQKMAPRSAASQLTPKEREVLQLIAEGKSAKEIAYLLELSGKTVDHHRHEIFRKLGIRSVAELVKFALREGITSLDQ